jgi:hypothetical protein
MNVLTFDRSVRRGATKARTHEKEWNWFRVFAFSWRPMVAQAGR